MEVVLRQLARFGFRRRHGHHGLSDRVDRGVLRRRPEVRHPARAISARSPRWGTAGGLAMLDRPEEPVLVINGDILTTLDFAEMYRFHRDPGGGGDDRLVSSRGQDRLRGPRIRRRPARPHRLPREARVLVPGQHGPLHPRPRPPGTSSKPGRPVADARPPGDDPGVGPAGPLLQEPCYWLDIGRHDDYATANEVFEARRRSFLGDPVDGRTPRSGTTRARRPATIAPSGTSAEGGPPRPDRTRPMIAAILDPLARS